MQTDGLQGQPAFDWSGRDAQGRLHRGRSCAGGQNQLRALLRRRGLTAVDVHRARSQRIAKPSSDELVRFTRQLASLLRAGLPLLESLQMIARTQGSGAIWALAGQLHQDLQNGLSLSAALRRQSAVFGDLYIALVEAGEVSGQLDLMLERIVHHLEKTQALVRRVRSALTYPVVVLAVAVVVLVIIMVAVVPSFEAVFSSYGAELPWVTQWVVDMSRWFVSATPVLLCAVLGMALLLIWTWRRWPAFAYWVEDLSLALPLWGTLLRGAAVARWSRTLATLLASGLPLAQALQSVRQASGRRAYALATDRVRDRILRGSSLQAALGLEPAFPPLLQQMAAVGEESGTLDFLLEKVADFQEAELNERVQRLSTLIEPATVLLLGLMVGVLVLSLYLPVFQMGQII